MAVVMSPTHQLMGSSTSARTRHGLRSHSPTRDRRGSERQQELRPPERQLEEAPAGDVTEAPNDGKEYVRRNGSWIVGTDRTGIEEAPIDGKEYIRRNGA